MLDKKIDAVYILLNMSSADKIIAAVLSGTKDKNIAFADLCKLLTALGFVHRVKGDHSNICERRYPRNYQYSTKRRQSESLSSTANTCYHFKISHGGIAMHKYERIIYWSEDDGTFIVEVPELPGCMADGDTSEHALQNAELVITEWLETAKKLGRDIPVPKGKLMYA